MPEDILTAVAGFTQAELEVFADELEAGIWSGRLKSLITHATTEDGYRSLASVCKDIDALSAEVAVILLVRRGIKAAETFITYLD